MTETGVIHGRFQVLTSEAYGIFSGGKDEMQDIVCGNHPSGYLGISGNIAA